MCFSEPDSHLLPPTPSLLLVDTAMMVKRNYASRNRKTQAKNRAQTGITASSETERILSVLAFRSPEDTNNWGDDLGVRLLWLLNKAKVNLMRHCC